MIAVVKAKPIIENVNMTLKKQMDEEKKLNEMMIPKKNKRLYNKIMYSQKKQKQEVNFRLENDLHSKFSIINIRIIIKVSKLKEKREKYDQGMKQKK
jgi:hypothetical protein